MRVLCAWCREEGAPALMEERSPVGDGRASYGICPSHRVQLLVLRYLGMVKLPWR